MSKLIKLVLLLGLSWACHAQNFKVEQLTITGLTPSTTPLCVPTTPGQVTNVGCTGSLPAGSTTQLQVLTSTPGPASGPTTKSCGLVNGGTVTSVGCNWDIAPQAGETIACTVFAASGNTITVGDGTNTYHPLAGHTNSAISTLIQQFYTSPITAPVTTTTASLTVSSFQPGILCNTVNGIAPSSPVDVQNAADSTTGPVSTALTTTANGDYIFCGGTGGAGSGFSNGSPFTLGTQYSPYFNSLNQYYVQPTAGAITASITGSVTTSASLLCTAFKSSSVSSAPVQAFTSAAPFLNDNLIVVNAKEWGAVGDGNSHQACTYLGLSTLAELQAYDGGIYSFATACTNQMDWLATQYSVNRLATSGGTVKIAGGTYIWDQPVVLPNNNDSSSGSNPGLYIFGDGMGGTLVEPSVADFGAGSGMISCQSPTASPTDNGNTGSGRYNGECYGGLVDLSFLNPYYNGTTNVSSTGYAAGVINVPGPSASGTLINMDGVIVGPRMYMHRVSSYGFRMAFNVVGDHMTWDQVDAQGSFCGMYWAPQSIYDQGDVVMQGHNFINGNSLAGFCVDKSSQFNLYQSGEIYVGYQPYGFIKFPGASAAEPYGGGYFPFIAGGIFDQIQAENTGNAVFWDDNITNSSGGVTTGVAVAMQNFSINSLFATWGTAITTGGRNQYAWIGASSINNFLLKNPFSCCGSFQQGGSGQIAGILAQYASSGGIEVDGDVADGLAAYTTLPFVGNTRYGGYCSPVKINTPGEWSGGEIFLDSTVTSVTAGEALMMLSDGNAGESNGTGPVIGIAAQTMTNPGTGQCLAYANAGGIGNTFTFSVPGSATPGSIIVAGSEGNGLVGTNGGGYVVGTAQGSGTTPYILLNGLGGYLTGSNPTFGQITLSSNLLQFGSNAYIYSAVSGYARLSDIAVDTGVGIFETPALGQLAANGYGGSCAMSTATTCTQTLAHAYTTPICIVTQQSGTLTGGAAGCTVSGTTVTVTAAVANSETWGFLVFGNPN